MARPCFAGTVRTTTPAMLVVSTPAARAHGVRRSRARRRARRPRAGHDHGVRRRGSPPLRASRRRGGRDGRASRERHRRHASAPEQGGGTSRTGRAERNGSTGTTAPSTRSAPSPARATSGRPRRRARTPQESRRRRSRRHQLHLQRIAGAIRDRGERSACFSSGNVCDTSGLVSSRPSAKSCVTSATPGGTRRRCPARAGGRGRSHLHRRSGDPEIPRGRRCRRAARVRSRLLHRREYLRPRTRRRRQARDSRPRPRRGCRRSPTLRATARARDAAIASDERERAGPVRRSSATASSRAFPLHDGDRPARPESHSSSPSATHAAGLEQRGGSEVGAVGEPVHERRRHQEDSANAPACVNPSRRTPPGRGSSVLLTAIAAAARAEPLRDDDVALREAGHPEPTAATRPAIHALELWGSGRSSPAGARRAARGRAADSGSFDPDEHLAGPRLGHRSVRTAAAPGASTTSARISVTGP